jgi:hypothetical protein
MTQGGPVAVFAVDGTTVLSAGSTVGSSLVRAPTLGGVSVLCPYLVCHSL